MKNRKIIIVIITLAVVLIFAMAACEDSDKSSDIDSIQSRSDSFEGAPDSDTNVGGTNSSDTNNGNSNSDTAGDSGKDTNVDTDSDLGLSYDGDFEELIDENTYEEFFPNRFGFGKAYYPQGNVPDLDPLVHQGDGHYDFYTYQSLITAVARIAKYETDIYQLEEMNYMNRIVWRNLDTNETKEFFSNKDYNSFKDNNEYFVGTVKFADFCANGSFATRKNELAAFLGNISHETTGMGQAENTKTWGLYWREEVQWQQNPDNQTLGYVSWNETYPATAGKSYHGRGPIQLSYNYNYGPFSEFIYGDKQVLLDNPEMLVPEDGTAELAFMSAIWFWMTPQAPKPSCHDVMVENWEPTAEDIAGKRDESNFGMTVNIINGGLECGIGDADGRVEDRIGFYERFANLLGVEPEQYCGCGSMTHY